MKQQLHLANYIQGFLFFLFSFSVVNASFATVELFQNTNGTSIEYSGEVMNSRNNDPLISAYLVVTGTNISTVTNSEGFFVLKVPPQHSEASVRISHLGFESKTLSAEFFKSGPVEIALNETAEELSEVNILDHNNPRKLVKEMLDKKRENYSDTPTKMEAFYRETIRKGRRNVSLSEAVIEIYKKPYTAFGRDDISVVKARKSADYERLDTLALKLRGGPYNTLVLDIMKNPDYLFYEEDLGNYKFEFDAPAQINNRNLYVVNFSDLNTGLPWYFGKLYIDAETRALVKAEFELNVDNRNVATSMFVKRKPGGTRVYPMKINYEAEYREQDGKWYFGYGNAEMEFLVNWKRRLFNSRYLVNSELAITDWVSNSEREGKRDDSFITPTVVMTDDVSGFADPDFWGANNIIEPDKSIENAIEKIQRDIE